MKVSLMEEHEDGSATFSFDMTNDEKEKLIEIGILAGIKKGIEIEKGFRTIELTPEQIDSIVIEDIKRAYRYAINHRLTHPEDIAYYEEFKKALELVLKHYMVKVEAEDWIEKVNDWNNDE